MATSKYERLQVRLGQIHNHINDMAALEANAALVGSYGSKGELQPIKDDLIKEAERIVDELFELLKIEGSSR